MKQYDLKDLANELNISERTARRYIDELINEVQSVRENKYKFSYLIFNSIVNSRQTFDTELTENDKGVTEYFTDEEYQEFQKRLIEYPILKEQIENSKEYLSTIENQMEYFKNAYNKQLDMHENLIQSVKNFSDNLTQRNFIEAKEKGLDR
ncbi:MULTISPECIES: HTH domain-containing protein [Empedobacter]|uniref:HTH domain-containing protein n=1 Tax=Empedobacter falsenii TaxID=343874 RepID=A0A427BEG0_9FLAO|nr:MULTISPECIES: HTH domain-containing protein [Empedobacter]MDH0675594.1 HTH domain-containing protein [Empedobacter sp. GD03861]RRT86369.1 HTH domain-containing protein [Empedobacter falsenii]RRT87426.1 HTH domain-containing protein [Empedobacter falsenii]